MTRQDAFDLALLFAVVVLVRFALWPLIASALAWEYGFHS